MTAVNYTSARQEDPCRIELKSMIEKSDQPVARLPPFQNTTTTHDIYISYSGTRLCLSIVILITAHVGSKRQFTQDFTLITLIGAVEQKFQKHGCPLSARNTTTGETTDRRGNKPAKQRGNAPGKCIFRYQAPKYIALNDAIIRDTNNKN